MGEANSRRLINEEPGRSVEVPIPNRARDAFLDVLGWARILEGAIEGSRELVPRQVGAPGAGDEVLLSCQSDK